MKLTIASFNVENLDDKSGGRNPSLAERAPILRDELLRCDADILCLQEVHGQETDAHTSDRPNRTLAALDAVFAGTPYADFNRVHTTSGQPYDVRNLVIASRFDIIAHEQYRNDLIDDLAYRKVTAVPADGEAKRLSWERPILHAAIQVPGFGLVQVLNLHLKSRLATNVPGQRPGNNRFAWNSAAGWAEGYFMSSIKRVGQALEARMHCCRAPWCPICTRRGFTTSICTTRVFRSRSTASFRSRTTRRLSPSSIFRRRLDCAQQRLPALATPNSGAHAWTRLPLPEPQDGSCLVLHGIETYGHR